MERLKRMSVFAKVVELGSFTAAARQLQMSVSSISQTVAKLEDELQVKLLNRSTRSLGLTEAGKIYYQGCRRMLFEAQDVHEQLYAFNNTPIGTLRIGCSSTMAQNVLARITAKMLKEYPGLSVNLVTGIPAPDLIADGLDVVIRVGALQDSSLFSRRLGSMPMVLCAAKSYLAQAGNPEKPADLAGHAWLEYSVRPDNEFVIIAPEGISTRLTPQGRFVTNDPMTLVRWLTGGKSMELAYAMALKLAEESEKLTLLTRALPAYTGNPRALQDVDAVAAESVPIEAGFTIEGWFCIRLPLLLPKKERGSASYIRGILYPALRNFFQGKAPVRYPESIMIFRHVYEKGRPERRYRDHDNIEINMVSDTVAMYVLTDDAPPCCDHFYCSAASTQERTEVYVVPARDFPQWLVLEPLIPDEGVMLHENVPEQRQKHV